ncbi:MAG: malectin domain-containing carbohydrate-binding protein, partial [Cyanobacteria bacterium P01_F01_bin.33]
GSAFDPVVDGVVLSGENSIDSLLVGGSLNDQLFGLRGNDRLFGLGGMDLLERGLDDDRLFGGSGSALLDSGEGRGRLFGGDQEHWLFEGVGNDLLLGRNGADELFGSETHDKLLGGTRNDLLDDGLSNDIITGPNGTTWVAEFGHDNIESFEPILYGDPSGDGDMDGLLNTVDPFLLDPTNGGSVTVLPGQTFLWDFDANQDGNLPGPNGYGGGLTGVMIDGVTDFQAFFLEPSTLPSQDFKLDNVKFLTAAGGETAVVEFVSNGDPFKKNNSGEYLFHTGATIAPTVDKFTVKWTVFNPASDFTGTFQQIGGYIGTGDQSNYLKLVAIQNPKGELQVLLEDGDVVQTNSFLQANDLFDVPQGQKIFFELEVDPSAATATPTISYETGSGAPTQVSGSAIDLSGTAVLDAIQGNYTVNGQTTGLALGLLSSNTGEPTANAFQAVFEDIEVVAEGPPTTTDILYRVNAGGPQVAAIDGDIPWAADTKNNYNPFLADPGSNSAAAFAAVDPSPTVPVTTPAAIFDTERWDKPTGSEMTWAFPILEDGSYEVRLYLGNGFGGTNDPGDRVFDVAIEGSVPDNLDDVDLSAQFGHQVGGVISNTVAVTDGTLNIEFLHDIAQNPLVNGIEIRQVENSASEIISETTASVPENQTGAIDINATDDFDSEGSGLNYAITGGDDASLFSINAGDGIVTFKSAPDFEVPGDANGDNDYQIRVAVTDSGGLSETQEVVITVTDEASLSQIEHANGSRITLSGETLPFASGEQFPVEAGDIVEFDRGYTDFRLYPSESEDTVWQVEIFPGDSFASFCLSECINTEEPVVEQITLLAGTEALVGNIIAYGFDPDDNPSVRLTPLRVSS